MNTKNKKIVKFNGGLGNQMFQYAFALALKEKSGADVVFDFSYFDQLPSDDVPVIRELELNCFNIECKKAVRKDFAKIKYPDFKSKLKRSFAKKLHKFFGINYVREKNEYCFDKRLFSYSDYFYYDGYFQNEKYFKHLRETLLKNFSLKEPIGEKNQATLNEILKTNSVSIHVRRGDYLSMGNIKNLYGVCSLDYYKKAVGYIAKRVENPHFFLFSDDIDWVIKNLKIQYPYTVVDFNQGRGWFDLELMKHCKHNIIANSSFSWWGAWLNENPDKIVIAPKKWNTKKFKRCSIVPKGWIKL